MRKSTLTILILLILALISGGVYYFYFYNKTSGTDEVDITQQSGFSPFGRGTIQDTPRGQGETATRTDTPAVVNNTPIQLPKLRQLSIVPIAGMSASTTKIKTGLASTSVNATIVRYVDRGTGHVYQANDITANIDKISNTTLPKIYEAYWNKNLNNLVLRYLKENSDSITNFYSEIRSVASSTASSTTPFEIKGKYLSPNIRQVAVAPTGDKIFTWNVENNIGVGYISSFDEKNKTKIIDTPITEVNIDWPENSTVTITTKGSGATLGYAYSIDTKSGEMKQLMKEVRGLSIEMSRDAKRVLYSIGTNTIKTGLLNLKDNSVSQIIFKTLADKCIWSTIRKNEVYCAVPTEIPDGLYPDDWYKGKVSFVDQIWHLDTTTGEVHLLANLLMLSNQLIDAQQLTLDPKENYLYFVNKRDLTLWSLDLNQ